MAMSAGILWLPGIVYRRSRTRLLFVSCQLFMTAYICNNPYKVILENTIICKWMAFIFQSNNERKRVVLIYNKKG